MALSKKEQAELDALEKEVGSGLTPEEEAELAQLEKEVGEPPAKSGSWQNLPLPGGTAGGYARGALKALPIVGATGGGLLGGIFGAGAGAYAGGVLKQAGEAAMGEKKTREETLLEPVKDGVEGLAYETGGKVISHSVGEALKSPFGKRVISKGKGLIGQVGEMLTGVPAKKSITYLEDAPLINNMAKESAGNTSEAADQMRFGWNEQINQAKKQANKQISNTISKSQVRVNPEDIYTELEMIKGRLDPRLAADEIAEIAKMQDDLMNLVSLGKVTDDAGSISMQELSNYNKYLKPKAKGQYTNGTGKMFAPDSEVGRAAQAAQKTTRGLMNKEPQIKEAYSKLAKLRKTEKTMNKNLLAEGKPEASILAAGGGNTRNAGWLKQIDDVVGGNFVKDADRLSAMDTFTNPPFLPIDTTGKSAARIGVGGGLGGGVAGLITDFNPAMMTVGSFAGSALTSPKALKAGLDLTRLSATQLNALLQNPEAMALALRGAKNSIQTKSKE